MNDKTDEHPTEPERGTEGSAQAQPEGGQPSSAPAADGDATDLRAERDRLADQLRRAMADLHNIRKRQAKEAEETRTRAVEGLAAELLPVLDNFELALAAHAQQDAQQEGATDGLIQGLQMVRSLLQGALERHGLAEIPAAGCAFDPNVHEAVGVDPTAEVAPGHVSKVMQAGYRVGTRVLRPAKVMVAPTGEGSTPPGDPE
ncbi:MAG: nucleotide exchange factor GrpE [Planctomycetota bacterium]